MSNNNNTSSKLDLAPHQVVLRPLVTEKGVHRSTRYNQYAFEVNPLADKSQIRDAIEVLYPNVKVVSVNTQNRKGKARRYRYKMGKTKNWKKAIITIDPEQGAIDLF